MDTTLNEKTFVKGSWCISLWDGRAGLEPKNDIVFEIKSLLPEVKILDNVIWGLDIDYVWADCKAIEVICTRYEEYRIVRSYLNAFRFEHFNRYFAIGENRSEYEQSEFKYDYCFEVKPISLRYLETLRLKSEKLTQIFSYRSMFNNRIIVNLKTENDRYRYENYISNVYGRRITVGEFRYDKLQIFYMYYDLSQIDDMGITAALHAPRLRNFDTVDEFIEWHSNGGFKQQDTAIKANGIS